MRQFMRAVLVSCSCLCAFAASASAQEGRSNNRNGLWGGIGLGYGLVGALDCDGCGTEGGFSGNARIGFTPSREFRLAVGTNGWYKETEGVGFTGGLLSAQALWFPGGNDFFLLGGAGYANFDCEYCSGNSGAGFVVGAGYDYPINSSGSLALTPYVNWIITTADGNPYILQFGLGLTFN